jgi:hypothetical protein
MKIGFLADVRVLLRMVILFSVKGIYAGAFASCPPGYKERAPREGENQEAIYCVPEGGNGGGFFYFGGGGFGGLGGLGGVGGSGGDFGGSAGGGSTAEVSTQKFRVKEDVHGEI